jgi:membrane dipeptidase
MPIIIDAHQDIAYNALTFGRDPLRSVVETRVIEQDTPTPSRNGHSLLGWPEYQRGQVAVIFSTLFIAPKRYQAGSWEHQVFTSSEEAHVLLDHQIEFYKRLCGDHPDAFRFILTQADLQAVMAAWEQAPAWLPAPSPENLSDGSEHVPEDEQPPRSKITHPVGLVLLMEGAEGIRAPEEMEEWWEKGVRIVGPVWAGTRFCGGMYQPGGFTREGWALLDVLGSLGCTIDISHMNELSAQQALDRYEGPLIASHANARALIRGVEGERHLTDNAIRRLIERDGVMGVVPFNRFLRADWRKNDDRALVPLRMVAAQIDHICQIAGDARHAGLGTDFDGGFGWPAVPQEINTIADLQKLAPILAEYGYSDESIGDIMGSNWRRCLERILPAA